MMCGEHSVLVRLIIVSLAVLTLTFSLIGVITPGWYNYEGKLVNYDMKMMIASKMFAENSKRTIRQAPANFDSDSESMPVKAPAEHEDKENQAESSDFASGSRPANGPAKGMGDEDRPQPPNSVPGLAPDMSAAGKETSNGDRPDTPNAASGSIPDNPPDGHESNNIQPHPAFTGSDGSGAPNHKIPKRPGNDATDNLLPPPKGPSPSDTRNGDNVQPRPLRPAKPDTGDSDEASSHLNHAQNQGEDGHTDDMYNRHPGMGTDGTSNRQPGMNNEDTANRVPGMDTDTIADHNDDDDTDNSDAGNGDKSGTDIMPPLLRPSNNGNPKPRPIGSFNRTRPTKPTRPPIGALPILLPSNRTRRPGGRPGFTLPTRIPLLGNKTRRPVNRPAIPLHVPTKVPPPNHNLRPLNISLQKETGRPVPPQWRPGSTKKPKNSGLIDQSTKPNPDDVNDKLDWFAGIKDKLTGSDTKPDWIMGMLKELKGGNFSESLMDKLDNVEYSIHLGLWFGKLCEMLDGVRTCDEEKLSILFRKLKTPDVSLSTWNNLRLESSLSLVFCFLGVVGTILTVKPLCLKTKPRIPVTMAFCGMLLACVLSITAIARIGSIYLHVNEILEDKHSSPPPHLPAGINMSTNPCHLSTPWSVVLCVVGAHLAIVTTLTLGLFILRQERMRLYRFYPDGDLANNDGNKEVYTDSFGNLGQDNKGFESAIGNTKV